MATTTFRTESQIELCQAQAQIAQTNLKSEEPEAVLEGYTAAVATFTRANLIISATAFSDKYELEQWEKSKADAWKLIGHYKTRINLYFAAAKAAEAKPADQKPDRPIKRREPLAAPITAAERAKILDLYVSGQSMPKIAKSVNRSTATVHRIINKATSPGK